MTSKVIGTALSRGLAGSRVHDFFEIAHIAGEAFRPLKESAENLLSPDDEKTQ